MINEVTGVSHIRMLYVQLHYRCNFTCDHCFHGDLLSAPGSYAPAEVGAMLRHFRDRYGLESVTFLGGEPLLYPDIAQVCQDARELGLGVEICTNGHYGFARQVIAIAPYLARLRVSLDGLAKTHDRIRQRGSFASAMKTIELARRLGLVTAATMTVTARNLDEVAPLARLLGDHAVTELKLHCLRPVGNAAKHPGLFVSDDSSYARMHEQIKTADMSIKIVYDADLEPSPRETGCAPSADRSAFLDRIEADPRGRLTMSCKAVGRDASAFRWDTTASTIVYEPHSHDELQQDIPDVLYQTA